MNTVKFKEIFVDVFEELERDALKKTKEYYVQEVARKLYFAIGTSSEDEAHNRLRNRLFELIRESFDEFIYPNQYGALVKQYRKNNCLNQQEFANLSGLSLRTVHSVEHGISFGKQTKKKLDNILEKQNETKI
jgi:DNA-binding XRE family transcriptional regulator